ncbi:MAG: hypothetical protein IJU50_01595 [Lachnospiraceae bacterium]|nr:hypothetical protein [Lachnospiraceae bacterium]
MPFLLRASQVKRVKRAGDFSLLRRKGKGKRWEKRILNPVKEGLLAGADGTAWGSFCILETFPWHD